MRGILLGAIMVAALLAGCSDSGSSNDATQSADFSDLDLAASQTTGLIRGVVVDNAIKPLGGVAVTLTVPDGPAKMAKTTDAGTFGFDGLAPGTYFVKAAKLGYFDAQQSVDVVAGVAEPPSAKILLQANPQALPFFETVAWDGFIECSARAILYGVALCEGIGNDDIAYDHNLTAGIPTFAQGELVWDSTQSLGDELSFNWRRDDTDDDYIDTEGPSPLLLNASYDLFAENEVGEGQPLRTVIFTGHNPLTEPPGGLTWGVGVQLQQRFTMYLHVFYNFVPPEGWRFTVDGDPQPP